MRRLSLTLLIALLALPAAALAARADKGDGVFEMKDGNGTFVLAGHGVLLGQMDKGSLRIQDFTPNDGQAAAAISGAERTRATDDPNVTVYCCTNIRFRVTDGKYRIRLKGSGIDLTAIGVGIADLTANQLVLDPGSYSLDGGKWFDLPLSEKFVPYGVQSVAPITGP